MAFLSIIIPTRTLGAHLGACLDACRRCYPDAEVILVIPAAEDRRGRSPSRRDAGCDAIDGVSRCILAPAGRGPQCNAGARAATGELLLFLHDDCVLPPDAARLTGEVLETGDVRVACFRLRFDDRHWLLGLYAWFSRFDSLLTSFGDQGILIRRSLFEDLGGFPEWPLFEDVELLRRARRRVPIRKLRGAVTTSAVRFRRNGMLRQQLLNAGLMLRYLIGVPATRLAERYERVRR